MSDPWRVLALWLLRVLLGGGLLLLVTFLLVRKLRQPARRQRVAEWGVVAALVLAVLAVAPSWLLISVEPAPTGVVAETLAPLARHEEEDPVAPAFPLQVLAVEPLAEEAPERPIPGASEQKPASPAVPAAAELPSSGVDLLPLLLPAGVCLYFAGSLYFLGRLVWGYVQLSRFLASASPVPEEVQDIFDEMSPDGPHARLLMMSGLRVPLSCGVFRPAVVIPAALCEGCELSELRWILAHELAHLRRRDALTTLLFGLARAVYFFLPWFWWLRRQVRLCQEYVADAAAVAEAGPVEEYAEFLLRWSMAPAVPAGATGVSGHSSDLFRRITMLVSNPLHVEERCPRRWSLAAAIALLSLAIVVAGVGLSHASPVRAADDTKKDKDVVREQPRKEVPGKDEKKEEDRKRAQDDPLPGFPNFDELLKRFPGGIDDQTAKLLRQQMEQTRKMMEQMRKRGPGALPQLPGGVFPQLPGGGIIPFPQIPQLGGFNRFPGQGGMMHEPRMGVSLERPGATIVDQLDLPREQGLIVEDLNENSAAAKAGVKKHDIILELDGKPVSSNPDDFNKQVQAIKPDQAVDAVVMRKSKKETIKGMKLPKMEQQPGQPGLNPFRLNVPLGGLNGFNGAFNGGFNGGNGNSIKMTRNNDNFTISSEEPGLVLSVTGKVADGKAEATEITAQEGEKTTTYSSVDKVPEAQRDKVRKLLEFAQRGKVRAFQLTR
jgi:beta-lactamase regulating signal transducer with metallopeptidase domain